MLDPRPGIALVSRPTRLQNLLGRWATRGQARFALKHARVASFAERGDLDAAVAAQQQQDSDFIELDDEDRVYQDAIKQLRNALDFGLPIHEVDRGFLPNFDFSRCAVVVVVGQDGLVANAAKYVGSLPIVAVNPDPARIDGILLPYQVHTARVAVAQVLRGQHRAKRVTLASAFLQDGQQLLAFNDFFVGANSHVSSRYSLRMGELEEKQSSSGIIISTGAGSTGWMSSIFNMTAGVASCFAGTGVEIHPQKIPWDARQLLWVVREPFISRTSQANLVAGVLPHNQELIVESMMASGGVIFSDGVESDFLAFNSGTIARIRVADQQAHLVVEA